MTLQELRKEYDNYIWFLLACGAAVGAAYVPESVGAVLLVLAGIGIEKAKRD